MTIYTKYNSANPTHHPADSQQVRDFCAELKQAALSEGALIKLKPEKGIVPSERLAAIAIYGADWPNYRGKRMGNFVLVDSKLVAKVVGCEINRNQFLDRENIMTFLRVVGLQEGDIMKMKVICHEKTFGLLSMQDETAILQVFGNIKYSVRPQPHDLNEALRNQNLSGKIPSIIEEIRGVSDVITRNGRTPAMISDWRGRYDLLGGHLTLEEAMDVERGAQLGLIRQTFSELELEKSEIKISQNDNEEVYFAFKKVENDKETAVFAVVVSFCWSKENCVKIVHVNTNRVYALSSVDETNTIFEKMSLKENPATR